MVFSLCRRNCVNVGPVRSHTLYRAREALCYVISMKSHRDIPNETEHTQTLLSQHGHLTTASICKYWRDRWWEKYMLWVHIEYA